MTSLAGFTLNYNTLDNNRNPRNGFYAELKQDFAGLGGDSQFVRSTGEARYYREIIRRLRRHAEGPGRHTMFGNDLLITDQFFLGPSLVRGFAPSGIGPRDAKDPRNNALGGTTYFGGTAEVQFPIFGIPRELGMRGAVFADAGTLFGYKGGRTSAASPPIATARAVARARGRSSRRAFRSSIVTRSALRLARAFFGSRRLVRSASTTPIL